MADSPKITAVLTSSEVVVGETVQLEIQIDNAGLSDNAARYRRAGFADSLHRQIDADDDAKIFPSSSSITYSYTILPEKSGTYKIPPQTIRVGKDNLQTPELTLRVADSPRATAGGATGKPSEVRRPAAHRLAKKRSLSPSYWCRKRPPTWAKSFRLYCGSDLIRGHARLKWRRRR